MDIWERIRHARDRAQEAENTEKQRLADADTAELQQAASVRLATRQAVREALDDILGEEGGDRGTGSDTGTAAPTDGGSGAGDSGASDSDADGSSQGGQGSAGQDTPLTGTSTSEENPEPSYAGAGTPDEGDVQQQPGAQSDG